MYGEPANTSADFGGNNPHSVKRVLFRKDFPLNHLFKISLVYEDREKQYKSPYYAFVSAWPAGKNGGQTTYLKDDGITFVMEIDMLEQFGIALHLHATGQANLCGSYTKWANPNIASGKSDSTEMTTGKNLRIDVCEDQKARQRGRQEWVTRITFNRGQGGRSSYNVITLAMPLYQARGVANYILYVASEARKMDFEHQVNRARQLYRRG